MLTQEIITVHYNKLILYTVKYTVGIKMQAQEIKRNKPENMATEIQNIKSSFRNMINCISFADKNMLKFKRKLSCANKYLKVI